MSGTWYADNGTYLDLQGHYAWFDSDLSSDILGGLVTGNEGSGYALSAEVGRRIETPGSGSRWAVTPQAQLVYGKTEFDSFTGPNGESVASLDNESLQLRLGVSMDRLSENGSGNYSHFYGIGNLYYEFLDAPGVLVSGATLVSGADDLWAEIGIGGNHAWGGGRYAVYGELAYAAGVSSPSDAGNIGATVGLRMRW